MQTYTTKQIREMDRADFVKLLSVGTSFRFGGGSDDFRTVIEHKPNSDQAPIIVAEYNDDGERDVSPATAIQRAAGMSRTGADDEIGLEVE